MHPTFRTIPGDVDNANRPVAMSTTAFCLVMAGITSPFLRLPKQPWLAAIPACNSRACTTLSMSRTARRYCVPGQSNPTALRSPVNLTYRHRLPASGPSVLSKLALASRNVAPLRCPTKPLLLKARQEGSASQAAASSPVVPYSGERARLAEGEASAPGRGGRMCVPGGRFGSVEHERGHVKEREVVDVGALHDIRVPMTCVLRRPLLHILLRFVRTLICAPVWRMATVVAHGRDYLLLAPLPFSAVYPGAVGHAVAVPARKDRAHATVSAACWLSVRSGSAGTCACMFQ